VAQSRQVAGAAERKARARSPSINYGLPVCVLPNEAPVPDQPTLRSDPDRASKPQFHASRTSADASLLLLWAAAAWVVELGG
jgi:hypothetical protein